MDKIKELQGANMDTRIFISVPFEPKNEDYLKQM